jgi:c-di-GMP-binding flagellar brake protein YcgR
MGQIIPTGPPLDSEQARLAQRIERRKSIRHSVDEACVMVPLRQGSAMACQMLNLSMDGCMIRTREEFKAGIQIRVEVSFKVNGIAFRFNGVTPWTDGKNLAGIAFVDVIPRRREALADVLDEVDAARAAKAGKEEAEEREAALAAQKQAARETAERTAREQAAREAAEKHTRELAERKEAGRAAEAEREAWVRQAREAALRPVEGPLSGAKDTLGGQAAVAPSTDAAKPPAARPAARERRTQRRHPVDTTAVIFLVRVGSELHGRIQDISAGGCRIRTDEPFPVGIYTRVETEFHVEGLPFRLGGVIQSIHDRGRFLVGIRFLDMSERKREQLAMLIEEIDELAARKASAGETGPEAGPGAAKK